jgi:hypothetical protein
MWQVASGTTKTGQGQVTVAGKKQFQMAKGKCEMGNVPERKQHAQQRSCHFLFSLSHDPFDILCDTPHATCHMPLATFYLPLQCSRKY